MPSSRDTITEFKKVRALPKNQRVQGKYRWIPLESRAQRIELAAGIFQNMAKKMEKALASKGVLAQVSTQDIENQKNLLIELCHHKLDHVEELKAAGHRAEELSGIEEETFQELGKVLESLEGLRRRSQRKPGLN